MLHRVAGWAHRLRLGPEQALARRWHATTEQAHHADEHARRERFLRDHRCRPGDDRIRLGRARTLSGAYQWCGLSVHDLTSVHGGVEGATGSGKSFMVAALLLQLLARRIPIILVDAKSELAAI